jgi:plastocyanin
MDLNGEIFWYLGGALVVVALVVSFVGIRGKEGFPPSRGVMAGSLVAIGLLVAVTSAYAIALAREEKEHRDEELAHAEAEAEQGVAEEESQNDPAEQIQEGEAPPEGQQTPSAGPSQTFELTSPEDGSLEFDPDSLETEAGSLTVLYANPSPVPHNVAVADVEEELLGESPTITESETELKVDIVPGEYIFYCTVPGHREGGMEGVITVQ